LVLVDRPLTLKVAVCDWNQVVFIADRSC